MFTDGVALEVDVNEERVEMVECDGSVVRFGLFLVLLVALADKGLFSGGFSQIYCTRM
jgi:hypothetical protein